ncbi:MAG: hypothetical protein HYY16_17160 [Planctomycetes bacterium]|nr:hypothetical protein [Planctomycetota bacterium]
MATRLRVEFLVTVPHQPGVLAQLLEGLAKGGVNVLAFCGWGEGEKALIMFVTDNDQKTRKALAAGGFDSTENPVLAVTAASGKGAGAKLAAKLAKAGVNIEHAYATTAGTGQSTAIFRLPDPQAALKALK